MSIKDLMEEFETGTELPVDPNKIVKWVVDHSLIDAIVIEQTDLNIETSLGLTPVFEIRDPVTGNKRFEAEVYFPKNLDAQWTNLIITTRVVMLHKRQRELITSEVIEREIRRVVEPPPSHSAIFPNDPGGERQFPYTVAAAALFPYSARELVYDRFHAGKIKDTELARRANIPPEYVRLIMSDDWVHIYRNIKAID